MSMEKYYLCRESDVDYDEIMSDDNLDIRDCTNCVYYGDGFFHELPSIMIYCTQITDYPIFPELPFFCSKFELIENKRN